MRFSHARGFTLLEVVLALAIAGLALGVLLRSAAISVRSVRVASLYEEAVSRAQSHLDAIGAPGVSLRPRVEQGDEDGGFHWSVTITPLATGAVSREHFSDPNKPAPRLTLFAMRVVESWNGGAGHGSVALATRRLGPPP